MEKLTKVVALRVESFSLLPDNAEDFQKFWQQKIESIPKEYRETAKIEFDEEYNYGSTCISTTLSYLRPETVDEHVAREAREKIVAELREDRELKLLEELKKKYNTQ